jgi:SAM-dependent methyltransferase
MTTVSQQCPLCGYSSGRMRAVAGGVVARCSGCGILYTVPPRTDAELALLYDDDYFRSWLAVLPAHDEMIEAAERDQEPRVRFLSSLRAPGSVLDVGAATGFFLVVARQYGWEIAAVEPSVAAWGWARKRFNLPPAAPSLAEVDRSARFDAICFWHSLEHHANLRTALRTSKQLLRPGGVVIIECPNAASLDARIKRGRWDGWHLPYHTFHFTSKTLSQELQRAGLRVLEVRHSIWRPLSTVARALRRRYTGDQPAEPFLLRQAPNSLGGRVASAFPGRDLLVVATRQQ